LYLVTGGAGFIGSNIVETLLAGGEQVRVLDNFSTGSRNNLSFDRSDKLEVIEGDVRDLACVRGACKGVHYILHEAALASVQRSVADPLASNDVNVSGTLNVLRAGAEAGVKRFVYASSSSVYGDTEVLPKHEGMTPSPQSPYATSKLVGEYYSKNFCTIFSLPVVLLRYFNVFGPRQDPESEYAAVIPSFVSQMIRGVRPTIYGDGGQTRDFTFVDDVVQANVLATQSDPAIGHVCNVASGKRVSVLDLFYKIRDLLGTSLEPIFAEPRTGDVRDSQADIAAAGSYLGFKPNVEFEDGLQKTVDYFKRLYST
jgi:nucleoside-diphosphate-sugar epimerase